MSSREQQDGKDLVIYGHGLLGRAAWISRLLIWHDDERLGRRKGEPCETWAAAMAASWRLAPRQARDA